MNILLIGERYSSNLGDGVIYDSVEHICKKIYGEQANIICLDISGGTGYKKDKKNNSIKEKIKSKLHILRKILSEITRINKIKKKMSKMQLKEIDGAIFVGGQLFSEYFAKPIYIICKTLNKYKVPIIFNCCGIGKNDNKKTIDFLSKTFKLNNISKISIRDNYEEFITKYNINKDNVEIIMDPVVEISEFNKIQHKKDNIYGIGVMDPKLYKKNGINFTDEYYIEFYKNIIENFEKRNIKWEFFCNGRINDYDYAKKMCIKLNISIDKIAKRPLLPNELIDTITKYSKIISFRLHSHIIAYSYNIPSIALCWDNKVKHFGLITNNSEYYFDLDENINQKINEKFDDFIEKTIEKKYNYKLTSEFLTENKFEG